MKFNGFDWDDGNLRKCQKHGVSIDEIEQLFIDPPFPMLAEDILQGKCMGKLLSTINYFESTYHIRLNKDYFFDGKWRLIFIKIK